MILVTGTVHAQPEMVAEVLRLSLEHVHRSRLEPGCVLHSVHQDVEDPNRVLFVEHWADREALFAHFAVPASRSFAREVERMTTSPSSMQIYEAEVVTR